VPILERGTRVPINASFSPILETFRTSCSKPNLQNPPRKGEVRQCFVPREGSVFVFCDYDTLEMRTLAQVFYDLFGYSPLRDALIAGRDIHLDLASEILGISYDEAKERYDSGDQIVEDARQAAKPGNFGFPGGMGAAAFLDYALKSYDVRLTPAMAAQLHEAFRRRWDMAPYFAHCSSLAGADAAEWIVFPRSKQVRGRVPYTAICNGFFQELAARGAKQALWEVSRKCYDADMSSTLYGARPVLFMHDEIGMEVLEKNADRPAELLAAQMKLTMMSWVPDVPISCSPVMMRRWYKGAKAVRVDGRLVPSKPVKDEKGKVKWVADV
jgi:DNA polymerase-1